MDAFLAVIQYIVDLGPAVMLPLIIMIIGLSLRQGIGKSVRAGLTIGVGFVGIGLSWACSRTRSARPRRPWQRTSAWG